MIAFEKVSACHKELWMDEGQRRSDGNLEREIIPDLKSFSERQKQTKKTQYNRRQDDSNQFKWMKSWFAAWTQCETQ